MSIRLFRPPRSWPHIHLLRLFSVILWCMQIFCRKRRFRLRHCCRSWPSQALRCLSLLQSWIPLPWAVFPRGLFWRKEWLPHPFQSRLHTCFQSPRRLFQLPSDLWYKCIPYLLRRRRKLWWSPAVCRQIYPLCKCSPSWLQCHKCIRPPYRLFLLSRKYKSCPHLQCQVPDTVPDRGL